MSKKMVSREQSIEAPEFKDKKGVALEDQLVRVFDDVLEVGEKIDKGYKPVKSKMFLSTLLPVILINLLLIGLAIFNLTGEQISLTETLLGSLIPAGLAVVIYIFAILFASLKYKNTYYLLTNKRLIIRTGVLGIDFKSLDIININASFVNVSILDKILRKNTGSLKFSSKLSQNNVEGSDNSYMLMHIQNPFQVDKEIKEMICISKAN